MSEPAEFGELRNLRAAVNGRKSILRVEQGRLTDVRRTRWAWEGFAPLGSFLLIAGEPGAGKGVLLSHVLANLTRGTAPGDLHGEPVNVLWVGFEDSWGETVLPRLLAAGADEQRAHRLIVTGTYLELLRDHAELARVVAEHDIRVICFEALVDHISGDDHKSADVRRSLGPLVELARARSLLAIGTTHLNKLATGTYRQRVGGSGGYLAVARVGWLVHQHPDDPDLVTLAYGKGNLGRVPASMVFAIEGHEVVNGDEVADVGRVTGAYFDESLTVDVVLAGGRPDHGSREDEVVAFLRSALKNGPVHSTDLFKQGAKLGFGEKLLKRHKDAADVVVFQKERSWWWKIPAPA